MAMHPKHISRSNDIYPAWDCTGVNNVGSDLAVGDLVVIDWTAAGDAVSFISPSSLLLLTTRMKAIVMPQPNQAGIPSLATGTVRVQGVCNAGLKAGIAATNKDPIIGDIAGNATDGGLVTTLAVQAPGTNSTYIQHVCGYFLETKASSASAQTVSVIFDGTMINTLYLRD